MVYMGRRFLVRIFSMLDIHTPQTGEGEFEENHMQSLWFGDQCRILAKGQLEMREHGWSSSCLRVE